MEKALRRCDVAIGALRVPHGRTPCVVNEDMIKNMKEGSVIVDVSIDKGGCFETSKITTHQKPTFKKFGIVHYGVPNIASRFLEQLAIVFLIYFLLYYWRLLKEEGVKKLFRLKRDSDTVSTFTRDH